MTTGRDGSSSPRLGAEFWRLWASSGLSNLADGILKVVLPLVAVSWTRNPALVAGVSVAFTLPWLLCALPAGVLVDRVDRRWAMATANAVRAAVVGGLALIGVFGGQPILLLYVAAFLIGTAETVYDTSAQSFLPQLLPRTLLSRANSRLFTVELVTNQFAGPPLAGLLATSGVLLSFAVPGGLWLGAIALLLFIRPRGRPQQASSAAFGADLAEGLRFVWQVPLLRRFAFIGGSFNLLSNAVFAVFVLFAVGPGSPMGLTEAGYGVLLTATAVGGVVGSLIAEPVVRRFGRPAAIIGGFVGGAILVGIPALTADPWLLGAVFALGAACIVLSNVVLMSLRQRITPDRLLGRVTSAIRLVSWGTMPLGALLGGLLADILGLHAVFVLCGVAALGVATLTFSVRESHLVEAEARNPEAGDDGS